LTISNQNNKEIEQTISTVCEILKSKETAIFCGAGISFNSGLPLVNDLLSYILKLIEVNNIDAKKLLKSNLPFEAFIQTLTDEVGVDDILEIFSKGEPNTNHDLIAELLNLGYVKTVLTTNFDILIEKALIKIGLEEGTNYQVFSTEKEFENIDWQSNIIKIIKIHGCISNKEEMAITLKLVARKTIDQHKNNLISSFFSSTINPNLLVLGYSCSDLFDISPIIESVTDNKSQITFLEHYSSEIEIKSENISLKDLKNPFQDYVGKRIYFQTDEFTKQIWKSILLKPYELKKFEISWKENIDMWFKEASEYSSGMKNQISARLFYDIGEYSLSIKFWEEGLTIAQKENNQIFFYAQLGNIGMALNAIGKFTDAKKCLEESVKACREIGNTQGEISQLQALGNIYRNLREFDNAIESFNKAVSLAEKNISPSLCSSLGNLATVYNQIEDYDNTIKILQKGLAVALVTGSKQSEGSMLTSLGIAFFQKGNIEKAFNLIMESIKVTRQIGDRQGECMSFHNLSNFCLQTEDYENCLKHSKNGLEIAKEIGIKPSEAAAYYNIGTSYFFKGEQESAIYHLNKAIGIYTEIFGVNHSHTISAVNALTRAEQFPDSNKMTKMRMK
jgi:tetratricopeptide (TPR) repeat protein